MRYVPQWAEIIEILGKDVYVDEYLYIRLSALFNTYSMNEMCFKSMSLDEHDWALKPEDERASYHYFAQWF